MNKIHEWINTGLVTVIAILVLIGGNQSAAPVSSFGSVTTGTAFPHGISVGLATNSPTNIADIKAGSCTLINSDVSQAATSTVPYDCAVPGVVSTDSVIMQITKGVIWPTGHCWNVTASKASTTAGFITALITNCGATASPSADSVGSSTVFTVFKTQ